MVACEMFKSQIIAPMIIMIGQPDGTLSRRFSSWDESSKVTFHPKHWVGQRRVLHLLGIFGVLLCRREGWFDLGRGF